MNNLLTIKLNTNNTRPTKQLFSIQNEEIEEIKILFPELTDIELNKFISALDCTINKVLDSYFGLGTEIQRYTVI